MRLNFAQMELIAQHDLEWLYCHSEAALGISSNYMPMIMTGLIGPTQSFSDDTTPSQLRAAHNIQHLRSILRQLTPKSERVLYYTYSDQNFQPLLSKVFGKYLGAVTQCTLLPHNQILSLAQRIAIGQASAQDKTLLSRILTEAKHHYFQAHQEYIQTKLSGRKND